MNCFVYIMATGWRGTLYVGVTSNLIQRAYQHKEHVFSGFTSKYEVHRLVWFEGTPSIEAAIRREKQIKGWRREWKIELVETMNPKWTDLYEQILGMNARDPGSSPG
ncbi:MAG TPA: GIY-YIG nuclease family protein [Ramlibacter sp.]|nr:GIY-YIG nuclease family protein [Ramlibacter sp.]